MAIHVTSGGVTFDVSSPFFFIVRASHILAKFSLHCAFAVVLWTWVIIAFLVAYHVEVSN